MFSKVDFKKYSETQKKFYDDLSTFNINESNISSPVRIDSKFLEKLTTQFKLFIDRRQETKKFTKKENIAYKELLKKTFPELLPIFEYQGPSVYWFKTQFSGDLNNEKVIEKYSSVRDFNKGWWTKVNPAKKSSSTNILYLGKVETALQNRFIQHIGLGHSYTTALKLQSWMPALPEMEVTFQFLKLDGKLKQYTEDIEKVLWEAADPLLGASPRF